MRSSLFAFLALLPLAYACSSSSSAPAPTPAPEAGACTQAAAPIPTPALHTPRWSFEPWISKDISDRDDTYAFVEGFAQRDIPVGVVVLDSPWETHYNTFSPDPKRYPEFGKMVRDMHDRNVRVVLWTTQMTNLTGIDLEPGGSTYDGPAANYDEGLRCGFYLNQGESFFWWKGQGSAVDFFNPAAVAWWHAQQDQVLDLGIDGWKLDFGENYIRRATVSTAQGDKPFQEYSEKYYEDFLAYGVSKRGRDFATLVRAWDVSYDWEGRFFARKEHAPLAWMGDNRRDWIGLADALDEMLISARAGYSVLGSDIGGYLDLDDKNLGGPKIPFDVDNFQRWVAVGAMSPFMQLHGRANLAPWTVPARADETVTVYRTWAKLHHALAPFFYGATEAAYAGKGKLVEPVGDPASWKGDYRYVLGGALLVAPILDASGVRDVALPAGTKWFDWFSPDAAARDGGTTVTAYDARDPNKMPIFVREGAIVPRTGDGSGVVLVYPGPAQTSFTVPDDDPTPLTVSAIAAAPSDTITTKATATLLLQVRAEVATSSVSIDGANAGAAAASRAALDASASGWFYDGAAKTTWIKIAGGAHTIAIAK